jgi:hypothetical protein
MRIQSFGGFHRRMGARLSLFAGFIAGILFIFSVDIGQFYFALRLHKDFSIYPYPYTIHLLISNPFLPESRLA